MLKSLLLLIDSFDMHMYNSETNRDKFRALIILATKFYFKLKCLFLYLSQPVVVAQFEQAREEAFTFSGPHELLPLPYVLLQQVLLSQLSLPLRLWHSLLACGYQDKVNSEKCIMSFYYFTERNKRTILLYLCTVYLFRHSTYLVLGDIFSRPHRMLWGLSWARVGPEHGFHYCRAWL